MGNTVFFTADDGAAGTELWKTDGTAGGTSLVKDIYPGVDGLGQIAGSQPLELTAAGTRLFFFAQDPEHGYELWKSDGTAAGTVLVKDIRPGPQSSVRTPSSAPYRAYLTNVNGVVYFAADDGRNGRELWKSDGTDAGTVMVEDIGPTYSTSDPQDLVNFNGTLYFTAVTGDFGAELWRSNGTDAGTVRVTDIRPFSGNGVRRTDSPEGPLLAPLGNVLYFVGDDADHGTELWRTDGTAAGTRMVKDAVSGPAGAQPGALTAAGAKLFFRVDGSAGYELWVSDGTDAGTARVQDAAGRTLRVERGIVPVGGDVYVAGTSENTPTLLWKTDGTNAGTLPLPSDANRLGVDDITNVGGTVFFVQRMADNRAELWKSDASATRAIEVKAFDFVPDSYYANTLGAGGRMYFAARDSLGVEPWVSDGTDAGTHVLQDLNTVGADSTPVRFFPDSKGDVYFSATGPDGGTELWTSDSSPPGTVLLKESAPRTNGLLAVGEVGGGVVLANNDPDFGATEFWKTDGAPGGTQPFFALPDPTTDASVVGGILYVATYNETSHLAQLWSVAGTTAAPQVVKEFSLTFFPGRDSAIHNLTGWNGALYFSVKTQEMGHQLWKSDGTTQGTVPAAKVGSTNNGGPPSRFTPAGDRMYLEADGLWTTDGTTAGTVRLPTSGDNDLTAVGGRVFFATYDNRWGYELWTSDGTMAGTHLVKDINDGFDGSFPASGDPFGLTEVGGSLYFFAGGDPIRANTLWKSDGTEQGTVRVMTSGGQFVSGARLLPPVKYRGVLYFAGYTADDGPELWRSDGTAAGTNRLEDIRPGPVGSNPHWLTPAGDSLFFSANDGVHGFEPWRLGAPAPTNVTGRHVFYNNSAFDGHDAAATLADLASVAPDKSALLPGQTWSFANVTSYVRGINGVLIDFAGMPPQTLTTDDFEFKVRGGRPTDSWHTAPPAMVTLLPSPVGANTARYAVTWPDGAIRNGWLEVTVKAGTGTGLAAPDVFYFGNLVGETGDGTSPNSVTLSDVFGTRAAIGSSSDLTGRFDFDRNGRVSATDLLIARGAAGHALAGPFDRAAAAMSDVEFVWPPLDRRATAPSKRQTYNALLG